MNICVRAAESADRDVLADFLAARADSCMAMRGNLERAGLARPGTRHQAQYAIALRDEELVGVVAHACNGMVLVQADEAVAELARFAVGASGRAVSGFSGPLEQVRAAREAVGLATAEALLASDQVLMSLALEELVLPAMLSDAGVCVRRADAADRARLVAWRAAYLMELSNRTPGPALDAHAATEIDAGLGDRRVWVLEDRAEVVAMCAFNPELSDAVQIGGVYTPPEVRRRGYARCVVAGALADKRARGGRRAVLFTAGMHAARAYSAVGFAPSGRFGLIVLKSVER